MKKWTTDALFAHRGLFGGDIPENSYPAFEKAIQNGFGAELDVHLLTDGSLAVFHDSALMRCAGVDGVIEDPNVGMPKGLRLVGSDEQIPTLGEILDLFSKNPAPNGKPYPLVIEIKAYKGNHRKLTEKVCEMLDNYDGDFVLESFDPRVLIDLKELRPQFVRGQLAQDFVKRGGVPFYQRFFLRDMWLSKSADPDFIAYRFEDRNVKSLRKAVDQKGVKEVLWTIRSQKDLDIALGYGAAAIFEGFIPVRK